MKFGKILFSLPTIGLRRIMHGINYIRGFRRLNVEDRGSRVVSRAYL
jgi:hypothetical protein